MKQTTISASEFKAKCLRLLDEIAQQGNTVVVTKRGRPIAKVTPVSADRKQLRGTWKNIIEGDKDIVYFDTAGDWEALQ